MTGVQTCALPICGDRLHHGCRLGETLPRGALACGIPDGLGLGHDDSLHGSRRSRYVPPLVSRFLITKTAPSGAVFHWEIKNEELRIVDAAHGRKAGIGVRYQISENSGRFF